MTFRIVTVTLLIISCVLAGSALVQLRPSSTSAPESLPTSAVVTRVVDGDTLDARRQDRDFRVRVIGIDTPELHGVGGSAECGALQARRTTMRAVLRQRVTLLPEQTHHDVYGRVLADVRIETGPYAGRDLAMLLTGAGAARLLAIPPNTAHAQILRRQAARARAHRRGIWRSCAGAGAELSSPRQR